MLARQRVREPEAIVGFTLKIQNQSVTDQHLFSISIYRYLTHLAELICCVSKVKMLVLTF